jgi:hypothetical protein
MQEQIAGEVLACVLMSFCIRQARSEELGARQAPGSVLTVRVLNFSQASEKAIRIAVAEARYLCNPLPIDWVDCFRSTGSECTLDETPIDVFIRILPTALPQAAKYAVGMTSRFGSDSSAAVFYDRAMSVRTAEILPMQVLGRAMAHEIIHLLLPAIGHSDRGLMKARWGPENLRLGSPGSLLLSPDLVGTIRREVARRCELVRILNRLDLSNN